MRGKPPRRGGFPCRARNIPAYAGKTLKPLVPRSIAAEHPRVCGENPTPAEPENVPTGTSPRMRGKLHGRQSSYPSWRNIPAYAGKTLWLPVMVPRKSEHPRVCGENAPVRVMAPMMVGTSPRMRGKRRPTTKRNLRLRNIPAYAGKTLIDVRFLVPEGHFTFGFVFLHGGGSMESP